MPGAGMRAHAAYWHTGGSGRNILSLRSVSVKFLSYLSSLILDPLWKSL